VPAGALISAGKSGSVARSLPTIAVASVKQLPASCIPSPESPAKRTMTRSFFSTVLFNWYPRALARCHCGPGLLKNPPGGQRKPRRPLSIVDIRLSAPAASSALSESAREERLREVFAARSASEMPRDHHLLHLVGALTDRENLGVAVEPAHRILLDVPVAAVDLHRLLGGAHCETPCLQLGLSGDQGERLSAL